MFVYNTHDVNLCFTKTGIQGILVNISYLASHHHFNWAYIIFYYGTQSKIDTTIYWCQKFRSIQKLLPRYGF